MSDAIFHHVLTAANESNCFIVACPETHEACVVDVGAYEPGVSEFLAANGLTLTTVFITHGHYDHVDGLGELLERHPGAEVVAGRSTIGSKQARQVNHGDAVSVGRLEGCVLAVPGHTPDMVCLHIANRVFTGDALFAGSVGGTTGNAEAQRQLDGIREHIFSLPGDTLLHTGHGPSSTVAVESAHNPFFV
mgnify:CR=1 FL=1